MAGLHTLGPVSVEIGDTEVIFRFSDPTQMVLEVPSTLELDLHDLRDANRSEFDSRDIVFDLQDVPAISSRQLGVLLAVRHAMAGDRRLPLRGTQERVRRLLDMTRMEQFFEIV